MSAILPEGTRNIAADSKYDVATQLSKTASIVNSLPIAGSAIFTEEPMNAVANEPKVVTVNAINLMFAEIIYKQITLH